MVVEYRIVTSFIRPPMLLNQMKRAHYHTIAKAKKTVGEEVRRLAEEQGIPRLGTSIIKVLWYAPTRHRRDNDSLTCFLKAAKDALVDAGVWEDDSSNIVIEDRLAVTQEDMKNPRVEVLIMEVA